MVHDQHIFFTRDQKDYENIDRYVKQLRRLAIPCEFGKLIETLIKGRLICGIRNNKLKERLLRESNIRLDRGLDICRYEEAVKQQISTMDGNNIGENIEEIQKLNRK